MDLSNRKQTNETSTIELYDPETGEVIRNENGTAMTVTVYGKDSKHYRKIDHDITNRNIAKASRAGRVSVTAEQLEAQERERIARCISAWDITFEGFAPPPLSVGEAERIMRELPWLQEQLESAMADRSAFFKASLEA